MPIKSADCLCLMLLRTCNYPRAGCRLTFSSTTALSAWERLGQTSQFQQWNELARDLPGLRFYLSGMLDDVNPIWRRYFGSLRATILLPIFVLDERSRNFIVSYFYHHLDFILKLLSLFRYEGIYNQILRPLRELWMERWHSQDRWPFPF